mgnify:FL=1|jgi:hypothetical protein
MKIDTLFEKYPENIIGFRVNKTTKIIDVWLNHDWELPTTESKTFTIKKQKDDSENGRNYYIIFSDTSNFDTLFESISKIIEHNLDIERKQKLFASKMTELKKLFTTLSYEELKEIQFDTPLALTNGSAIDTVVDVTEEVKDEKVVKPKGNNARKSNNSGSEVIIDKSDELISPEVREHEIDLDDDEVDNVQPIELKQI